MGKKKIYRKRQPCQTTWLLTAYSTFLGRMWNNNMRLPRCDSPTPLTVRCIGLVHGNSRIGLLGKRQTATVPCLVVLHLNIVKGQLLHCPFLGLLVLNSYWANATYSFITIIHQASIIKVNSTMAP